jgi:thiol:disulfide interchange protein DsbC
MNLILRFVSASALAGLCLIARAGSDEDQLRAALAVTMPQLHVDSITKLPYGDLYEVVVNKTNIFYTTAKGDVGLFGSLVDLKSHANLTEQRRAELRTVDFSRLPFDKAIVKVKGDGSRKLAIFTDPDCPYCKQLEKELAGVSNVTLYIFLYPIAQLHPDAPRKSKAIWCAPDRVKAWDDLMIDGKAPPEPDAGCETPIADLARSAAELHIDGTPGLIFGNGRMIPGAIPAADIEKYLNGPSKS